MNVGLIRRLLSAAALGTLMFCLSSSARADNLHLCDISPTVSCNAGSVIPTSSTTAFVFGTAATGDTLNLAILNPLTDGSGNFNSGTNLWTALLGVNPPPQNFPNFSSAASQESSATGIIAGSFDASSLAIGNWTGTITLGQTITLPSEPVGTIYVAYLTDSQGQVIAVSPWSSSLIATPEPSSIVLLGAGLLGIALLAFRR
jgi:hypothetical protein